MDLILVVSCQEKMRLEHRSGLRQTYAMLPSWPQDPGTTVVERHGVRN